MNGATDAVCSICGVVSSGALTYKKAALFAGVMNFAGLFVFAHIYPSVAKNVSFLGEGGIKEGIAVLLSVVVWSSCAWLLSIPTSESHGLLGAVAGAMLAKEGRFVVEPVILSVEGAMLSAVFGALLAAALAVVLKKVGLKGRLGAVMGCGASAFFHGAQDGQKFLAVAVSFGLLTESTLSVVAVASVMLVGTLVGGRKMVTRVGERMTRLSYASSVASDAGCALSLLLVTLLGLPASTTHTKTCSIAGAALLSGERVDKKELAEITVGWVLTVPACMLLSFYITKGLILM